jgi:hypothetical protein
VRPSSSKSLNFTLTHLLQDAPRDCIAFPVVLSRIWYREKTAQALELWRGGKNRTARIVAFDPNTQRL